MVHRTLNIKVCVVQRTPNRTDLLTIRKYLQYQIEKTVEDRAEFIPTFNEPCRIERYRVYVYCSDEKCADWVKWIASAGICNGKHTCIYSSFFLRSFTTPPLHEHETGDKKSRITIFLPPSTIITGVPPSSVNILNQPKKNVTLFYHRRVFSVFTNIFSTRKTI